VYIPKRDICVSEIRRSRFVCPLYID